MYIFRFERFFFEFISFHKFLVSLISVIFHDVKSKRSSPIRLYLFKHSRRKAFKQTNKQVICNNDERKTRIELKYISVILFSEFSHTEENKNVKSKDVPFFVLLFASTFAEKTKKNNFFILKTKYLCSEAFRTIRAKIKTQKYHLHRDCFFFLFLLLRTIFTFE